MSGSSARKLRRGGANLLGGRALDLKLHPLTCRELSHSFSLQNALEYGTLPKMYGLLVNSMQASAIKHLKSYVTTYIKEEIQAEALTRNIGAFNRFLDVAAQSNGQIIEFANISRECAVPASTVKEYYQILEDTLLGFFLWPFDRNERKKARPKFYFFDCGVVRALQHRLQDPPTPRERGILFETWMIGELRRLRDYLGRDHQFSFWRNRNNEIDIIISKGRNLVAAVECKSGAAAIKSSVVAAFKKNFLEIPVIVASANEKIARKAGDVRVLPWREVLEWYEKI
jgi:predicted AAA+ superfamily ATPase